MNRIYKYVLNRPLPFDYMTTVVSLPKQSKILSCGLDPMCDLCIWVLIDVDALGNLDNDDNHTFHVVGTGAERELESYTFIGTVLDSNYMWHIFEG